MRTLVWLVMALAGCGGSVEESPLETVVARIGQACAPSTPCQGSSLCVDGICVEREAPPEPVARSEDAWVVLDLGDPSWEEALEDGDPGPQDGETLSDSEDDLQDALDLDGALDSDGPPLDGQEDGAQDSVDAPTSDGALDATSETDGGSGTQLILLKNDSVEVDAGETFFLIKPGEAWVADLVTPMDGELLYVELFLANTLSPVSCGQFRVALWLPDAQGVLPSEPSFVEVEPHLLGADPSGEMIIVGFSASITAGPFRLGIVHDGPCVAAGQSPALMSDASGDTLGTWLWIPIDGTLPWVPASFLGIDGRWALRAVVEIEKQDQ